MPLARGATMSIEQSRSRPTVRLDDKNAMQEPFSSPPEYRAMARACCDTFQRKGEIGE